MEPLEKGTKASSGGSIRAEGLVKDLTERKRAEEALRESEEPFRTVFETAGIGIALVDMQGHPMKSNAALQRLLGYTAEELSGMAFTEFTHPDDREPDWGLYQELMSGKREKYTIEKRYIKRDGQVMWGLLTASLVRSVDGRPEYGVGMVEDITDRKRAEEALRRSEQRYKDFISHSNEGVWRLELDQPIPIDLPAEEILERCLQYGYIAECNLAHARNCGFSTPEEMVGKRLGDLVCPLEQGRLESFRSSVRSGWQSGTVEFRTLDKAGNPKHFLRTEIPIIENGMLVRAWGITRNVTELKRAEVALRESEEHFRRFIENVPLGVYRTTPDGRVLKTNPTLLRMLGYDSWQELASRNLEGEGFEAGYPRSAFREQIEREGEIGGLEAAWKRRDGSVVFVREFARAHRADDGSLLYYDGIVEDITERRRAEEALKRSRDRLRALAARLQTVREEERKRVAREIHDQLGQALTAVKIGLSSLIHDLPAGKRQGSESVLDLIDRTIQSVRRISTELRPMILDDLGLVAAVEWAGEDFEARTKTKCRMDLPRKISSSTPSAPRRSSASSRRH